MARTMDATMQLKRCRPREGVKVWSLVCTFTLVVWVGRFDIRHILRLLLQDWSLDKPADSPSPNLVEHI